MDINEAIRVLSNHNDLREGLKSPFDKQSKVGENSLWVAIDAVVNHFKIKQTEEHKKLCDFFQWFRDNGDKHIGKSIEDFVSIYLTNN